jgi:hypothetical protein
MILEALAVILLGVQLSMPEFKNNSLYAFTIDNSGTIIVQNTQTGYLYRCDQDFKCTGGLDLNPPKKKD